MHNNTPFVCFAWCILSGIFVHAFAENVESSA